MLWYMLILAVTLSVFSIFLYQNFKHSLYSHVDDLLQSKAEGISDAIDTYWEIEKLSADKKAIAKGVFNKTNNINFIKIAQEWVEEKSSDPKLVNIIVRIFDANGAQVVSSKNIVYGKQLSKEILNDVLSGRSRFDDYNLSMPQDKNLLIRLFTMPIIEDNKVAYIVQVGRTLDLINTALKRLRAILFLLLPATVFLTGIAGATLAKLSLGPVDNMIKTIRQITAENLKLKINIPDTKDEIKSLAETFNGMLTRLDSAFSSQKQFIQDVSHELKTPLTILKGQLEVTLKKIRSHEEYESVLISSLEEIDKISKIVENLLVLARFDTSQMPFEVKKIHLNSLIKIILDDIKILAEQKNIKIDFSADEEIILEADENQLRQLFLNLLDNAIKYNIDSGNISIALNKTSDESVRVSISDTGIGIPENDQSRIFDRFYRVDKSRNSQGFGLGLSIAKSIVALHKGEINFTSRPGQGTTFTVLLPLSYKIKIF